MDLTGIHHLTAVSADIRGNYRFYTGTLGMRLVKRSVNQDDVSAYHLFYADAVGSPGTDLTFFDWKMPQERRGTRSLVRTHLRVRGRATLEWWAARFASMGVPAGTPAERDGRLTLDFEDPEGQRLALVDDGGQGGAFTPWDRSPVPVEHQIRGLGPIVMSVPSLGGTVEILTQVMHLRPVRTYPFGDNAAHTVQVFEMGEGGPEGAHHKQQTDPEQRLLPPKAVRGVTTEQGPRDRSPQGRAHGQGVLQVLQVSKLSLQLSGGAVNGPLRAPGPSGQDRCILLRRK